MPNDKQLKLFLKGTSAWNSWRFQHQDEIINLSGLNISNTDFSGINLHRANLANSNFSKSNFSNSDLSGADLSGTNLSSANLSGANLSEAHIFDAIFFDVDLSGSDLSKVKSFRTNFAGAKFSHAILYKALLWKSELSNVDFSNADLTNADLSSANLFQTNFNNAILIGASLRFSNLSETNFEQSTLTNCRIYGVSVWDLKGRPKDQTGLIITPDNQPIITVDDLEVAQFIYLLLKNEKVRNIIDTITSKAVLILGNFIIPERKKVLNLIRAELRKHNYVPIIFDFENKEYFTLMETVMILAGMARFIIADVTSANMVREEVRSIAEKYPSKPIQPILLDTENEYGTLTEIQRYYNSILKTYKYKDHGDVISYLKQDILTPAEEWLEARQNQMVVNKTAREIELEKENETLRKRLESLIS